MTDLEEVSHYLDIEVDINREKSEITLRHSIYLKKILQRFQMQDCRSISTQMEPKMGNFSLSSTKKANKKTVTWYQSVVDSLIWPAIHTRLDLSYSVGVLSRYCSNLGKLHFDLIQRVLRYVSGTLN